MLTFCIVPAEAHTLNMTANPTGVPLHASLRGRREESISHVCHLQNSKGFAPVAWTGKRVSEWQILTPKKGSGAYVP